jgi:hypothetical protein
MFNWDDPSTNSCTSGTELADVEPETVPSVMQTVSPQ